MKKDYETIESLIENRLGGKEDLKSLELMKKMVIAKERGYCDKKEFLEICMWKSPRPKRHYIKNSEEDIVETTKEVFSTDSEKKKVELLIRLRGVSIPTASAVLTITDPGNYGVIDIRVWQIFYLYGVVRKNPQGVGFDVDSWCDYLMKLRSYAKKFNVNARDIERTLFYHHKEIQEGNLYK